MHPPASWGPGIQQVNMAEAQATDDRQLSVGSRTPRAVRQPPGKEEYLYARPRHEARNKSYGSVTATAATAAGTRVRDNGQEADTCR